MYSKIGVNEEQDLFCSIIESVFCSVIALCASTWCVTDRNRATTFTDTL